MAELPVFEAFKRALKFENKIDPALRRENLLTQAGFSSKVASSPLHNSPLPSIAKVKWSGNVLLWGPYHSGKTTLAANAYLWSEAKPDTPDKSRECMYWNTGKFLDLLLLIKRRGMADACAEFAHDAEAGSDLEESLVHLTQPLGKATILILDDFNTVALSHEERARLAQDLVLRRYAADRTTWLLSNETTDSFKIRFPALSSRIFVEPDWSVVETKYKES